MQQQLGIWGPPQHLLDERGNKKNCVEMAGRRTFRILTTSQQSGEQKLKKV
jgi:hypothetical protein